MKFTRSNAALKCLPASSDPRPTRVSIRDFNLSKLTFVYSSLSQYKIIPPNVYESKNIPINPFFSQKVETRDIWF